ncbi:probable LRR receptor-like serine/threonine-protein kinase At4g36180 [Cryptomeria japonica]|uniref:probable LRR receptor-like serine/threonine-protein kinase At4g36180 n=1 Tax=Cryptomeria japonica TaxID=3369 RepID=UPI0027DA452D|nr:probable LRR receptor-like serine/threonine-protein kinase At4g36180 [Cryptomeria japonica]
MAWIYPAPGKSGSLLYRLSDCSYSFPWFNVPCFRSFQPSSTAGEISQPPSVLRAFLVPATDEIAKSYSLLNLFSLRCCPPNPKFGSLRHLDLSGNEKRDFPEQISTWLQNFTALQMLDLSGCTLSGNIFPIWNLPLRNLSLDSNHLSGDASFIFCNQSLLSWLSLMDNNFGGMILVNISLPSLTHLDLSFNNFGGLVLESIARMVKLQHLILGYNNFSGQIPILLSQLSSLSFLDLGLNQFSGGIPSNLGDLSNLQYLDLSKNQLNGSIPSRFTPLSRLEYLDLSFNMFTSAELELFENLTRLQFLIMSNNKLTLNFSSIWNPSFWLQGALPLLLSAVEYLDLSDNFFSGSILPLVGLNLITLILFGNNLSGAFTSSICSPYMDILDLSSNKLSGSLPPSLANCSSLGVLNITNNDFDGEIPQDIGNITSLGVLHMNDNKQRGSLPSSLRYYISLKILDLGNNGIEGHIPNWIKYLQQLRIINLSFNKLRGMIPSEIPQLQNPQILDISKNSLTGELPTNFSGF